MKNKLTIKYKSPSGPVAGATVETLMSHFLDALPEEARATLKVGEVQTTKRGAKQTASWKF